MNGHCKYCGHHVNLGSDGTAFCPKCEIILYPIDIDFSKEV